MSDSEQNHIAKVAATRIGAVRHSKTDADNIVKVEVEWVFLFGTTYRAAKFAAQIVGPRNEQDFKDAVKDALLEYLQGEFPAENLQSRDIMLFGF